MITDITREDRNLREGGRIQPTEVIEILLRRFKESDGDMGFECDFTFTGVTISDPDNDYIKRGLMGGYDSPSNTAVILFSSDYIDVGANNIVFDTLIVNNTDLVLRITNNDNAEAVYQAYGPYNFNTVTN